MERCAAILLKGILILATSAAFSADPQLPTDEPFPRPCKPLPASEAQRLEEAARKVLPNGAPISLTSLCSVVSRDVEFSEPSTGWMQAGAPIFELHHVYCERSAKHPQWECLRPMTLRQIRWPREDRIFLSGAASPDAAKALLQQVNELPDTFSVRLPHCERGLDSAQNFGKAHLLTIYEIANGPLEGMFVARLHIPRAGNSVVFDPLPDERQTPFRPSCWRDPSL